MLRFTVLEKLPSVIMVASPARGGAAIDRAPTITRICESRNMTIHIKQHSMFVAIACGWLMSLLSMHIAAQEPPKQRAGLWEMVSNVQMGGKPSASKSMLCMDESMAARNAKLGTELSTGMSGTNCQMLPRTREGGRYKQVTECKIGNAVLRTVSFTTFHSDSSYSVESTSTYEPPLMGLKEMTMTVEGKYVGPCPAGMRAGDVTQGGQTVINTETSPYAAKLSSGADMLKQLDDSAEQMAKLHEDTQQRELAELAREAASPQGVRGVANILVTLADAAAGARGKDGLLSRKGQTTGAALSALATLTITDEDVVKMARAYAKILDTESALLPDTDIYSKRLQKLTKNVEQVDGLQLNFKVYKSDVVNAFAMADGTIRFYTGAMDLMTDDELRFIIGHEIGHVKLGHSAAGTKAKFVASALTRGAAAAAMKNKNGEAIVNLAGNSLKRVFNQVLTSAYTRSQELESDAYAIAFMKKHLIPSAAAASALKKLARAGGNETTLFSTHPAPLERAEIVSKTLSP
jgi:metalloprotease